MSLNQKFNKACKEYEKISSYKRKTTQIRHLNIAKNLIKECIDEKPDDYDFWYLLGLIWYEFSYDSKERGENCEKALKKSIELRPDYNWSNMYLGHLYFDQEKYEDALYQFAKLESKWFDELDLHWRELKYEELILCCKFYLHPNEISYSQVNYVCELYENIGDDYCPPLAQELVVCLTKISHTVENKNLMKQFTNRIKEMLLKIGDFDVFKDDFEIIESNI